METVGELVVATRAAGVAELCWWSPDGLPRATAVVPLHHEGLPTLALHPSQWGWARELAACPEVAMVVSDRRMSQRGWVPGAGYGRMRLVVDADGSVFQGSLLEQELRKHPPSRACADSPLLRREHWWFLARLLLVWQPVRVHPVGERTDADRHAVMVVVGAAGGLAVDTVDLDGLSLSGRLSPPPGAAVRLFHDFSVPDLERWGRHAEHGTWDGRVLTGDGAPRGLLLPQPPSLRERVRRHRALERECVRALRGVSA